MAIIWTYDLEIENKVIYYPIVDEDDTYFWVMPIYISYNSRQAVFKNDFHLSRVIGVVNES